MTVWRMRITCLVPKATNAHSEYVIFIAFPLQQWQHERYSVLHYTYISCVVLPVNFQKGRTAFRSAGDLQHAFKSSQLRSFE
jgi:hypothetical protein